MKKTFLILVLILSINRVSSQPGLALQLIPKTSHIIMLDGIVPGGLKHLKYNPALSLGAFFDLRITEKFEIDLGCYYHINRYVSRLTLDYLVDSSDYFISTSIRRIEFPHPSFGLSYCPSLFKEKLRISCGLNYRYTNAPGTVRHTESVIPSIFPDVSDGFKKTTYSYTPDKNYSRWGWKFGIDYRLFKRRSYRGDIGIMYLWTGPSTQVTERIELYDRVYTYSYLLKNSFLGLNLQLRYEKEKKDKDKLLK